MRRYIALAVLAAVGVGSSTGVAAADDVILEVSGPAEVAAGEEIEITVSVRQAADGAPVEGAPVTFFGDAFFAGVTGEIQLGSADTNSIGVATFVTAFTVRGVHQVRVEIVDHPEAEAAVTVGVGIGAQIIAPEVGVAIPGIGSWLVTTIIGAVWAIMIVAALWMVRVSRSGRTEVTEDSELETRRRRRRPSFNLAPIAAAVMILLALGLVTVLLRSPDTHHNFDPEGYNRSPVAYLDAAYFYPGPGLVGGALSGDAVSDGRALFLKLGCAGCHGLDAQGAAAARSPAFATRPWLETVMRTGLPGGMPPYPETDVPNEQVDALHAFLVDARDRLAGEIPIPTAPPPTTPPTTSTTTATPTTGGASTTVVAGPTFAQVMGVLQPECASCHGSLGGWSAADHDSVVNSGDSGPAVIPGDPEASILAQKLLGTQSFGTIMPPSGSLSDSDIQLIVDWIAAGAPP